MKIVLNKRADEQLLEIMGRYGFTSPTHAVQVMIGKLHNTLNEQKPIPTCEDDQNDHSNKEEFHP